MEQTQASAHRSHRPRPDLPQVPARWWEALGIVLAAFVLANLVAAVIAVGLYLRGGDPMSLLRNPSLAVAVSSLLPAVLVVGYVWLRGRRPPLPVLGFRPAPLRRALTVLAAGAAGLAAIQLVFAFGVPDQWQQAHLVSRVLQRGVSPLQTGLIFLAGAVVAPLAEETLLRGYLFRAIDQRAAPLPAGTGFLLAAFGSSALFGVLHLGVSPGGPAYVAVVNTFLAGVVLCWVYKQAGSLWPAIGLHAASNAGAFIVVLAA